MINVTRNANWERVPNGTLPKIWGGSSLPYGETTTPPPKKRSREAKCILVTSTDMSSWESVAAVSCSCLTDANTAKNYWPSKIYIQEIIVHRYYWTSLLIKISSFTGCKSFLKSLCVHGHMYCFHHRLWSCAWSQTYGTVTRQSIRVHQWCSCLDIQEYVYGTMVVINNISSLQSLCVTIFIE